MAVASANEAVNDEFMLRANQQEIDNILATVNRIAKNTQYGQKNLLDGSKGCHEVLSLDPILSLLEPARATQSSGPNGYDIHITQAARRAQVTGVQALTNEIIDRGEQITIIEGAKTVNFQTIKGETVETNLNALNAAIQEAGLDVDMIRFDEKSTDPNSPQIISLRHKEFGSEHSFKVATTTAGLLGSRADAILIRSRTVWTSLVRSMARKPQVRVKC